MRRVALLATLAALTACSTSAPPPSTPQPPAGPPAAAPPPSSPGAPADTCGARQHQHLVGRPRTEIPVPVNPDKQRVACTTCPVTMDFNEERLNFFFDASTGLIKEVRCG
jgi:hypothetical protein